MSWRRFGSITFVISVLGVLLMMAPGGAEQALARKIPRVGVLIGGAPGSVEEAFRQGLRDLGYREGQNILVEVRHARGDTSRFADFVAELVRLGVDVIVAPTPQAVAAARKATTTTPIVFAVVGDPVRTGLVASLARPGGRITGLTALGSDLGGKRLAILKEMLPQLSKVAILWNPDVPDKLLEWEQMQGPARTLRLQLQSVQVRVPGEFPAALGAVRSGGAQGMIVLPEPLMFGHRDLILDFASRSRLPALYAWREFVERGGLVAYGPSITDNLRRAATYVDKILRGAKPADLPVEQPARFELFINAKTANALALRIPQSLLVQADRVIE
jgi:putative ABC transport system substrate-binding protein